MYSIVLFLMTFCYKNHTQGKIAKAKIVFLNKQTELSGFYDFTLRNCHWSISYIYRKQILESIFYQK